MAFQLSPGVNVQEIDLTTVVPAVATTEGAIAGVFKWGPVDQAVLIGSENELVARFGPMTDDNGETFGTAASFLAYGNRLYVSRAASNTALNAIASPDSNTAPVFVRNEDDYLTKTFSANVNFVAKYAGELGNSLLVSVCDSATAFRSTIASGGAITVDADVPAGSTSLTIAFAGTAANTAAAAAVATLSIGDIITIEGERLRVAALGAVTGDATNAVFAVTLASPATVAHANVSTLTREWEYADAFDRAPGTSSSVAAAGGSGDELHVIVVDVDGKFSNARGTVLQTFPALSRATDAKGEQGGSNFFKEVINRSSPYVWVGSNVAGLTTALSSAIVPLTGRKPAKFRLFGGADGADEADIPLADLIRAYDVYRNAEQIDISLIMQGKARGGTHGEALANWLIDNVAEARKDCIVFVSPAYEDVVNNPGGELDDILEFRAAVRNSSYAVMDSGYKYMYDRYNDKYRYVPLNGDMAGLAVRTDETTDPWFSPAGLNRGQVKNVVKLAFSPDKTRRDSLYKLDVNAVVSFVGQGTLLYGDKTLLGKPSAFDRINVRRLFIVLEKAIATASKFSLFEFNDAFTRARFRNIVEPFLRDVQGRRGIVDFRVICDETNNTGEVIDRNEFVGDIYVKPSRSINFINLRFTAVRTGVEFSEIIGGA